MSATDRTGSLVALEALGLLSGTRRAGRWSEYLPELTGIPVDSRQTRPGHPFPAPPGSNLPGAGLIP